MAGEDGLSALAPVANGTDRLIPDSSLSWVEKDSIRNLERMAREEDRLAQQILNDRDARSVLYSKSLLVEGDTLVFIRFLNDQQVYDAAGFLIRDQHIVHRQKLLDTGSEQFIRQLTSPNIQYRLKRSLGVVNKLPSGVSYVLDLTPPEEGDATLIENLWCSLGIRKWYTIYEKLGVQPNLVAGNDETTTPKIHVHTEPGSRPLANTSSSCSNRSLAERDVLDGFDLQEALRRSVADIGPNGQACNIYHSDDVSVKEALEYSPIRHRTGIERLLQAIEGKNPRLDSAPKVWTLVVLADHFGCAKVVEDHVMAWLMAEPNCAFIEVLPEVTLRIGIMLKNEKLTRDAFSILVSEEALNLGTVNLLVPGPTNARLSPPYPHALKNHTRLHRPIQDVIDEDWRNTIQHASRSLAARVKKTFDDLLEPSLVWLQNLPEFKKLAQFEFFLSNGNIKNKSLDQWKQFVTELQSKIGNFVRCRLLYCTISPLDKTLCDEAHKHRIVEGYVVPAVGTFASLYNTLNASERCMTRFFWSTMARYDWSMTMYQTSQIYNTLPIDHHLYTKNYKIAQEHGVKDTNTDQLRHLARKVNAAIIEACQESGYNRGVVPAEAFLYSDYPSHNPSSTTSGLTHLFSGINVSAGDANNTAPLSGGSDAGLSSVQRLNVSFADDNASTMTIRDGESLIDIGEVPKYQDQITKASIIPQEAPKRLTTDWWYDDSGTSKAKGKGKLSGSPYAKPELESKNGDGTEPFPKYWKDVSLGREDPQIPEQEPARSTSSETHVLPDCFLDGNSVLFNIHQLLREVGDKLSDVCLKMLSRGEVDSATICDTLLCLSEEEFQYLPLWAGGLDDGSGGVFQEFVPPAERGGPSEPGPAYHTGSTRNSLASVSGSVMSEMIDTFSLVDGHTTEGGVATSVLVGDGQSDYPLDRREVYSEADFPNEDVASLGSSYVLTGALSDALDFTHIGDPSAANQDHPETSLAPPRAPPHPIEDDGVFFAEDEEAYDFDFESEDRELTETEDGDDEI